MHSARIVSIFSSIQGEGVFAGRPQLFIRLAGCNIRCEYCDTPESLKPVKSARIEANPFSGKERENSNPITSAVIVRKLLNQIKLFSDYHALSVTGGEPLLETKFLKEVLPAVRRELPVLLETNGLLPERLKELIKLVDIISMDIKMPSDIGRKINWQSVYQFLKISSIKPDTYVKVVLTDKTDRNELLVARSVIHRVGKDIPLVLQPVSRLNYHRGFKCPSNEKTMSVYRLMKERLNDVRIIPQIHRLMHWK
ncbi:MAG: 7-carboxy-7-deazaguanine synthase QueE [Candidatus Brocadiia bacterium]